jgi:hypothetical protein
MQLIWKVLVHVLTITGWHVRSDYEVDVAEKEDDDREGSTHRRVPVIFILVEVEVYESCRDEGIDDSKRVRYHAEAKLEERLDNVRGRDGMYLRMKLVSITSYRCIERLIACPKFGEGKDPFKAQLLDNCDTSARGGKAGRSRCLRRP